MHRSCGEKPHHLKIRYKLTGVVLMISLIMLTASAFSSALPGSAYDEQLVRKGQQLSALFEDLIRTELGDLENITYRILGDDILQENLSCLKDLQYGSSPWTMANRKISERVGNIAIWFDNAVSLQIKTPEGVSFQQYLTMSRTTDDLTYERMEKAMEAQGSCVWETDYHETLPRLFLLREIRETDQLFLRPLAVVLIEIDVPRMIQRHLNTMKQLGVEVDCAVFDDDHLLYSSGSTLIGDTLPEKTEQIIRNRNGSWLKLMFEGKLGLKYVTLINYTDIRDHVFAARMLSALCCALVGIIGVFVSVWMIRHILSGLEDLADRFHHFAVTQKADRMEEDPFTARKDEIGELHRHFLRTAAEYETISRQKLDQQQALQEKQFRQIRAQVRPHFLMNTLQSIYCLAEAHGETDIACMTEALGSMFKSSLNDQRDIISLREDLDMVEDYMSIQRLRYGSQLDFQVDIPEELKETEIASMTLQPLVENSVHHALEEMNDTCVIRVQAERENGDVLISVIDNGKGMDEHIIEKLENGSVIPDGLGIGMRNIHHRLRYAFGEQSGLEVHSAPGKTAVTVRVPAREKGKETEK